MSARDVLRKAAGAGAATLAACSPQSAQLSPRPPTTNADLKSGDAISSVEPEALTTEAPTTSEVTTTTLAVVLPTTPPTTLPIPDNSIARGPLPVNDDVWWRLAMCESSGKNLNTGNGYWGFLQFSLPTWWGIGETGYPTDYSYDHQRAAGERLQALYGWGSWPSCASSLGLL